jgi:hypothetical protein
MRTHYRRTVAICTYVADDPPERLACGGLFGGRDNDWIVTSRAHDNASPVFLELESRSNE